jgi:hypothetical protein
MDGVDETALINVPCFLAAGPWRRQRRAFRGRFVVFIRLAFPAARYGRGARGWRWFDVDLSILDGVDEAPAVRCNARIETYVDVRLAEIAAQDERRAGLLRSGVPVTHRVK